MKYLIYIKSHTDWPDYEDECEAKSFKEAVKIFQDRINRMSDDPWSYDMIAENVISELNLNKFFSIRQRAGRG